jgi:RNA-directed DNA polymerase
MALVEAMSSSLQLPTDLILRIARKASHAYKEYKIPKRDGGHRLIHHPSRELKALQRWLLRNIVSKWPVHPAAFAYRKGIGIKGNASMHVKSRYLLRMDFEDFFPSITAKDIDFYLKSKPPETQDWKAEDRRLFMQLVCRKECLTIGAPTSPALSNALCHELDCRLSAKSEAEGVVYTRYADDLFFSTTRRDSLASFPQTVTAEVSAIKCPGNLKVNPRKTRHASKKGRRQVTGLVLSSDGRIALGRSRKRYIRRQVHRLDQLTTKERSNLAGLIAHAMSIEPDIINSLILKFGPDRVEKARSFLRKG